MWFFLGGVVVLASVVTWLKGCKLPNYMTMLKAVEVIRSVPNEPMPAIHVAGNVYMISYLHDGQVYRLYFPIRPDVKDAFKDRNVYLSIGETTCDLNQEPGVPYSIQAGDFCPEAVVSIMSEDDESVISFHNRDPIVV